MGNEIVRQKNAGFAGTFLKPEKPQLSHYSLFSWGLWKLEICECFKSEELSPHSDLSQMRLRTVKSSVSCAFVLIQFLIFLF